MAGAVQLKARFQPDNNYFMGIMLAKQYTRIPILIVTVCVIINADKILFRSSPIAC